MNEYENNDQFMSKSEANKKLGLQSILCKKR